MSKFRKPLIYEELAKAAKIYFNLLKSIDSCRPINDLVKTTNIKVIWRDSRCHSEIINNEPTRIDITNIYISIPEFSEFRDSYEAVNFQEIFGEKVTRTIIPVFCKIRGRNEIFYFRRISLSTNFLSTDHQKREFSPEDVVFLAENGCTAAFYKIEHKGEEYIQHYNNNSHPQWIRNLGHFEINAIVSDEYKGKKSSEIRLQDYADTLKIIEKDHYDRKYKFNRYYSNERDKDVEKNGRIYTIKGIRCESVENLTKRFITTRICNYDEELELIKKDINNLFGNQEHLCKCEEINLFKSFISKVPLTPYRTDWVIYDEENEIAGTIDYVDATNIIYMWTNTDDIIEYGLAKTNSTKNISIGETKIPNLAYSYYAIKLNFLKHILQAKYNIQVERMRLGIFNAKKYEKGYVLDIPDYSNEVQYILNARRMIIY